MLGVGSDYPYAAKILRDGGLIAFPTETVYGIGGSSVSSITRLYALKKRDRSKPCAVYVPNLKSIATYITMTPLLEYLADAFWPGPLTIVVPLEKPLPLPYTGSTVGIRIPAVPYLLQMVQETGPFLGSSANFSGESPASSTEEVLSLFGDHLDYIVSTSEPLSMTPSTVIALEENRIVLLREGAIPFSQLTTYYSGIS